MKCFYRMHLHKKSLSHGKWLTDIIDAAQALLRQAHPYMGWFESVSLGETPVFTVLWED